MASNKYWRTALGAVPGAANIQIGVNPSSAVPAGTGQENAPMALPSGKPAAGKPAASRKRKSTEDHVPVAPAVNLDDIDLDDADIDKNCDQVRRKINRLLDSGGMTKTAFTREIGVRAKSLNGFLGAHGQMNGAGFGAYGAAWQFFKKREMAGIKLPVKKTAQAAVAAPAKAAPRSVDLSDIHLDGEDLDAVPVFDTCDEVRRKNNAHLKKPGGTQLTRFRNSKGALTGAKSAVFYAAYVFFEKMRIKEGKPKSKHRLDMEKEWDRGGIDRTIDGNSTFFCRASERPVMDKYGKISFY
ncbi:uncharacterized protein B0T15DRAFT_504901 [Chaetomium strumarium]|uniref:DUF7726 domain-containing protein n=1 Tax=Chaetomium strumarium TaxID=1170767 RepID=A0AAJ0GPF8_9PEZI|nr:hypothetical protein B0T15DRAFT_504901 [Chaetomium strumarium]